MEFGIGSRSVVIIFVRNHADAGDKVEFDIVRIREIFHTVGDVTSRLNSLDAGQRHRVGGPVTQQ